MSMLNRARGEAGLVVNGEIQCLCLTLGALAQIETSLGTSNLDNLAQRLRILSAADVLAVLSALLMGGGNPQSIENLCAAQIDPAETAIAIAETFSLAMQDV